MYKGYSSIKYYLCEVKGKNGCLSARRNVLPSLTMKMYGTKIECYSIEMDTMGNDKDAGHVNLD